MELLGWRRRSQGAPGEGARGGYDTVDVQEAYQALNADERAQFVDVRNPEEWAATGTPRGATLIPLPELERRARAELAADAPVYLICRIGKRSRVAAETLVRLGFSHVHNVEGGIQAWLGAGLPVERYERQPRGGRT